MKTGAMKILKVGDLNLREIAGATYVTPIINFSQLGGKTPITTYSQSGGSKTPINSYSQSGESKE